MVGWHHQQNGHELGQTLGDGEAQGSLVCCRPRGHKDADTAWRLNNNNSLQNCEIINFCCSKSPSLWFFVMATNQETNADGKAIFPLCHTSLRHSGQNCLMWDEQRKNVCVKDLEASWKISKQVQKVPQPFSSHYIYECEEVSSTLDKLCHQVESTRDNYMLCWAPSPVFIVVHLTTPKSRVIPADLPNYTQDASFFCSMFLFFKGLFFFKIYLFIFGHSEFLLLFVGFLQMWQVGANLLQCMGFSWWWLLLLQSTGFKHFRSVVVAHGFSCPVAWGIVPDQGSNPCSLHQQVDF